MANHCSILLYIKIYGNKFIIFLNPDPNISYLLPFHYAVTSRNIH